MTQEDTNTNASSNTQDKPEPYITRLKRELQEAQATITQQQETISQLRVDLEEASIKLALSSMPSPQLRLSTATDLSMNEAHTPLPDSITSGSYVYQISDAFISGSLAKDQLRAEHQHYREALARIHQLWTLRGPLFDRALRMATLAHITLHPEEDPSGHTRAQCYK